MAALTRWERPKAIGEFPLLMAVCKLFFRLRTKVSGIIGTIAQDAAGREVRLVQGEQEKGGLDKGGIRRVRDVQANSPGKADIIPYQSGQRICAPPRCIRVTLGSVLEQVREEGSHDPVVFWSRVLAERERRTWTAREK